MSRARVTATILMVSIVVGTSVAAPVRFDYLHAWIMDDNRGYLAVSDNWFDLRFGDGLDDRFTFGAGIESELTLGDYSLLYGIIDRIRYRTQIISYTSNAYAEFYYTGGAHFRTDLFVHSLSVGAGFGNVTAYAGLTAIFAGNWGGEWIQNGFHRMIGYEEVNAPYSQKPWLDLAVPLMVDLVLLDTVCHEFRLNCSLHAEGVIGVTQFAKQSAWAGGEVRVGTGDFEGGIAAGYKFHRTVTNEMYRYMYSSGPYLTFYATLAIGPLSVSSTQAYNIFGSDPTKWSSDNRHNLWSVGVGDDVDRPYRLFFH